MAPLVVALGEAMLRLSPPANGRLEEARTLDIHVAGSELNVAVALASLGLQSRWISALPDTPLGRRALLDVRAAGVDAAYVQQVDARMGLFFVEFGAEHLTAEARVLVRLVAPEAVRGRPAAPGSSGAVGCRPRRPRGPASDRPPR